jgi:hypothetical protein
VTTGSPATASVGRSSAGVRHRQQAEARGGSSSVIGRGPSRRSSSCPRRTNRRVAATASRSVHPSRRACVWTRRLSWSGAVHTGCGGRWKTSQPPPAPLAGEQIAHDRTAPARHAPAASSDGVRPNTLMATGHEILTSSVPMNPAAGRVARRPPVAHAPSIAGQFGVPARRQPPTMPAQDPYGARTGASWETRRPRSQRQEHSALGSRNG